MNCMISSSCLMSGPFWRSLGQCLRCVLAVSMPCHSVRWHVCRFLLKLLFRCHISQHQPCPGFSLCTNTWNGICKKMSKLNPTSNSSSGCNGWPPEAQSLPFQGLRVSTSEYYVHSFFFQFKFSVCQTPSWFLDPNESFSQLQAHQTWPWYATLFLQSGFGWSPVHSPVMTEHWPWPILLLVVQKGWLLGRLSDSWHLVHLVISDRCQQPDFQPINKSTKPSYPPPQYSYWAVMALGSCRNWRKKPLSTFFFEEAWCW